MAMFPGLKTGAVAQYPADRERRFSTDVVRFVDGSEQRFAGFGAALRRWVIRLELLDESELTALAEFFQGRAGTFSFTDPWDGVVYPNCSFEADEIAVEFGGVARGKTTVVVRENRV